MSQIPSSPVASIAQAPLAQSTRASENDAPREAAARQAEHRARMQAENREFVEDLVETAGPKVDADDSNQSEKRKKKRQQVQADRAKEQNAAKESDAGDDARSRSAALLANPADAGLPAPPPFMLDIEA